MKRAIVISARESVDSKSSENVMWLNLAVMPTKGNDGKVYSPKKEKQVVCTNAGEVRSPDKYARYKKLKVGDLVEVHYAINENTDVIYVSDLQVVQSSPYKESDLIV